MGEDFNKPGKGAVVGLFHLWGEDTGREFIILQVVGDAFTAFALSGAGLVGTGALCLIDFNLAFHL